MEAVRLLSTDHSCFFGIKKILFHHRALKGIIQQCIMQSCVCVLFLFCVASLHHYLDAGSASQTVTTKTSN
jgi:energy-converting hydrogenase Eha subunit C